VPCTGISTYSARAAQLVAFRRLAAGPPGSTPSGSTPPSATVRTTPVKVAADATASRRLAAGTSKASSSGRPISEYFLVVLVLLLGALYVLRVRAVRRRRARRRARQREARNMMRRGSLPIVDGRYRTRTRVGKPVESHVKLKRDELDDPRAYGAG
jgi:hypothetical protein